MDHRNGTTGGAMGTAGVAIGTAGIRGKDDDKKLFVGGLPKPCGEKELKETFNKFGEVKSVHIKMDPYTGLSRGYCFIVFADVSVVEKVLNAGDILINGKKVDAKKVTKSTLPGKLFVGGLTSDFSENILREYFGKYGSITEIQWPIDKTKNQRKPFCFITFEDRESVSELLKRPKQTVNGRDLDIKKVKFNPETMGGSYAAYARRGPAYAAAYSYAYPGYVYDYSGDVAYDDYYIYDYSDPFYYDSASTLYTPPSYTSGYVQARSPRGIRPAPRHAPY